MKKILLLLSLILVFSSLSACGKKEENEKAQALTPLFRLTVDRENAEDTRLFYLPESDGFLYLHSKEEGGFTGGFVSTTRSVSAEGFIKGTGNLESVTVWEKEADGAYILSDKELIFALLKEGGAKETPLPKEVSTSGAIPLNDLSFLAEKDSLVLVHPVDFAETYVLCDKTLLSDFGGLITPSADGKKIWYAKKSGSSYTGIGFFEYGKNTPLGNKKINFDSYETLSSSSVLLTQKGKENTATYRYLNLDTGEEKAYTSPSAFAAVTASADGSILCGISPKGEGCEVSVIDLNKGEKKGSHIIEFGKAAGSLAMDKSASTLLLAFGSGKDQILATLDLTKF